MKSISFIIICLGTFLTTIAALAQVSRSEQAIIARFSAQYGAPYTISRGNYNAGLLVVKFFQPPNIIITITIFTDGTFKLIRRLQGQESNDEQPLPVEDVPDDEPENKE